MKKIGVLLCLVALTTGAFASQTTGKKAYRAVQGKIVRAELENVAHPTPELLRALVNYHKVASENMPSQTGMILPAIAGVADIYLANREVYKEFAKAINHPVTFKNGVKMSMTRYIDEFASETDGLETFKAALEEGCNAEGEIVAQKAFNDFKKAAYTHEYYEYDVMFQLMDNVRTSYMELRENTPAEASQIAQTVYSAKIKIANGNREITIGSYINMEAVNLHPNEQVKFEAFRQALEEDMNK